MVQESQPPVSTFLLDKPSPEINRAGVYAIYCDANDKYYIGSSRLMGRRQIQHSRCLRNGYHANRKITGCFSKYGARSLHFKVIEYCATDTKTLLATEKKWMTELDCVNNGLNIMEEPNSCAGRKLSDDHKQMLSERMRVANLVNGRGMDFSLRSPSGEIVSGNNLANFCRDHGMNRCDANSIYGVIKGRAISHKGWSLPEKRDRLLRSGNPFCLIPPQNTPIFGTNLKDFCANNGLDYAAISAVLRGEKKQHNGWIVSPDVGPRKFTAHKVNGVVKRIMSPDGHIVEYANTADFCRQHQLHTSALSHVMKGTRAHHKGWRKIPCS